MKVELVYGVGWHVSALKRKHVCRSALSGHFDRPPARCTTLRYHKCRYRETEKHAANHQHASATPPAQDRSSQAHREVLRRPQGPRPPPDKSDRCSGLHPSDIITRMHRPLGHARGWLWQLAVLLVLAVIPALAASPQAATRPRVEIFSLNNPVLGKPAMFKITRTGETAAALDVRLRTTFACGRASTDQAGSSLTATSPATPGASAKPAPCLMFSGLKALL